MASAGSQDPIHVDDPALEGGEWLFKRDGQVFGPVDSRAIAAMLYRGELDAATPISTGDGAFTPVGSVPAFVLHAKKAEAALRVEREVTGARLLARRKRRFRSASATIAALALLGGALFGAYRLASRPQPGHALLEDFGSGIRLASAARIGAGRAEREEEFAVTFDPAAPPRPARPAPPPARAPAAAPAGDVAGGELVAARWDEGKIQSVVAREQRTLAPCFREEARRSPDFRGDIPIEFAIGNDGRVAELWIDEPRFRQGPLRECLFRTLRAWRFEPFPGQRPTVSLAFRIDG
ncbi:MAG TPA: AgmX/PglI C-terminal domain-containing protein [Anaeromyxobacteraceae bacterium]|nr:AgmX/PglI C-terminal domain-containing protein [Anaeromyxobacteraceae bacterium]